MVKAATLKHARLSRSRKKSTSTLNGKQYATREASWLCRSCRIVTGAISGKRVARCEACGMPSVIYVPSKLQLTRFMELLLLERAGVIQGLEFEPRYELVCNNVRLGSYTADARYTERATQRTIVEDVKPKGVPLSRDTTLKLKLMEALHAVIVAIVHPGPVRGARR